MAGATQERRLLAVGSSAMLGPARRPGPRETVPDTFSSPRVGEMEAGFDAVNVLLIEAITGQGHQLPTRATAMRCCHWQQGAIAICYQVSQSGLLV